MSEDRQSEEFANDIDSFIGINELLQVSVSENDRIVTYHSRISDVSNGKLVIAWPMHAGIRLIVHRDQILNLFFMRDGTPHEFSALVEEMATEPLPALTVIQSSAVAKVQRRQNFRVKCLVPVQISGSRKGEEGVDSSIIAMRTTTCDLSASGLAILALQPIAEGAYVDVKLSLPDGGAVIKLLCRVAHSDVSNENRTLYRTGIQYLSIAEAERARIVRYVYRTQLKDLRS